MILTDHIYRLSKANGLEIFIDKDDKATCRLVTTAVRRKKIDVSHQQQWSLQQHMPLTNVALKSPVNVVFTGKGILLKKIAGDETGPGIFNTAFPQARPEEFYFEVFNTEHFAVCAIARKDPIDGYVKLLLDAGFKIINIHLGFSVIDPVLNHLPREYTSLVTHAYTFSVKEHRIESFQHTEDISTGAAGELPFGEKYIAGSDMIALSAAIELLADRLDENAIMQQKQVYSERVHFKDYLLFRFLSRTLLGGLFLILLINFLLFSHFESKNKEVALLEQENRASYAARQEILNDITAKQQFLERSGWKDSYKISFMADRIGSLVPSEIRLTALNFNPPDKQLSVKANTTITRNNIVVIEGLSDNPVFINQFINNLKIIPSVKNVSILNFNYDQQKGSGAFVIELSIL